MRDVVRKHLLYEPPCSTLLVPNAQRAEGAAQSLFPNVLRRISTTTARSDSDDVRCESWENDTRKEMRLVYCQRRMISNLRTDVSLHTKLGSSFV